MTTTGFWMLSLSDAIELVSDLLLTLTSSEVASIWFRDRPRVSARIL